MHLLLQGNQESIHMCVYASERVFTYAHLLATYSNLGIVSRAAFMKSLRWSKYEAIGGVSFVRKYHIQYTWQPYIYFH